MRRNYDLSNQEIKPISIPDNFIPYTLQCNDDSLREIRKLGLWWNFSFEDIFSFVFKKKPPERIVFDSDQITRKMLTRDRKAVLRQWEDCGLDQVTAEYYMDYFALKDNKGKKYNLIIPADPAMIFVWYRYGFHYWEEIGYDFGIYTYIWVYGFFFPHLIFEIPSSNEISDEDFDFLCNNHDNFEKFEHGMTMRRVVELILLYKNERNMNSRFFDQDIPTRPICCNEEWRRKLESAPNPC